MMMQSDVLNIFCYDWSIAESYGRVALELKAGFEARGVHVNCFGNNAPQVPIKFAFGGIALGYPTSIEAYGQMFKAGPQVWVTAFESTQLPFLWADILNTSDAVIVPASFLIDVFKTSGVDTPVFAIPQGVSKVFQPMTRLRKPDDPFTFLAIADRGRRKGWHHAGFAFKRAFDDDMGYRLILKAREGGFPPVTNPNFEVIAADYTDEEMAALYGRADCFISPGAEGFGLPGREFAATGGVTLALDWGGTADSLTHWGLPIRANMVSAWKDHPRHKGVGEWGEADIDDLARTMRMVADHRNYWSRWAAQNSRWVRFSYDWRDYANQVYAVWQEAVSKHGERGIRAAVS